LLAGDGFYCLERHIHCVEYGKRLDIALDWKSSDGLGCHKKEGN
jgi:hypothetical protein